ncbi:hypothetical protein QQ056_10065 [Oscillatoria laete-virens NRMC-F 0139]|nr:hypothetical protein [Oscillatoria laete-virens]MDL5053890.1 hypothetical protein [Oscillatoria laete-virens NRMC-F 0139]
MNTDKRAEEKKGKGVLGQLSCLSALILFFLVGCSNHDDQQNTFNATVSQKDQALRKFLNIISLEGNITVPRGVGAVRPIVICFKDDNAQKAIVVCHWLSKTRKTSECEYSGAHTKDKNNKDAFRLKNNYDRSFGELIIRLVKYQ